MVAFPVNDPAYESTQEGGLFVRLVIMPQTDTGDDWLVCSGGWNLVNYDEEFIGDDGPVACPHCDTNEYVMDGCLKEKAAFPHLEDNDEGRAFDSYQSVFYLAVLTLGSTGWSGVHKETQRMWRRQYRHLTDAGKALYQNLQAAYPGRRLVLQTWLDT